MKIINKQTWNQHKKLLRIHLLRLFSCLTSPDQLSNASVIYTYQIVVWYHSIIWYNYAETAAKSQYFVVCEIFVNIQFELLFYNNNNHPWHVFIICIRHVQNLAKNHWKHVKLNKVLDNDGHPPPPYRIDGQWYIYFKYIKGRSMLSVFSTATLFSVISTTFLSWINLDSVSLM